jgi:hypothetical protein
MRADHAGAGHAPQRLPQVAFLLLFPGFFFYHSALGLGYIGAFAGGFFTPAALALILPLLFAYAGQLHRSGGPGPGELAFFGFMLYLGAMWVVQVAAGADGSITRSHLLFLLDAVVVFIIFRLLDVRAVSLHRSALVCLLLMSAIVFTFAQDGMFYLGALGLARDPESVATYQGFSRSYLFVYLVVIVRVQSRSARLPLYLLAGATLYVNGARSEFVAMLSSVPLIELYRARQRARLLVLLGAAGLVVKLAIVYGTQYLPENRTLELLDLSQSSSATLRHQLNAQALETIANHPIQGSYASYAPGSYAHNILSAWVDLGVFGFLALVALLLWPLQRLFVQCFLRRDMGQDVELPLCLCCTTVLLLLGSHHYHDMLIAATLGSYGLYNSRYRADANRSSQFSTPAI